MNSLFFYASFSDVFIICISHDFEYGHPKDFPMIPREISIGCHWLTVEGIQPLIPQNPSLEINEVTKQEQTIETKPIIRHSLSKELQMYYDMIVEILNTNNTVKIKHCLDSVRTDNGLQQLTPYFIRYISNHTFTNLSSLEIVNNMLWKILFIDIKILRMYILTIVS